MGRDAVDDANRQLQMDRPCVQKALQKIRAEDFVSCQDTIRSIGGQNYIFIHFFGEEEVYVKVTKRNGTFIVMSFHVSTSEE